MLKIWGHGFIVLVFLWVSPALAQDPITATTWNIEMLGGEDRGLSSGFGKGELGPRTDEQLKAIAVLIRDTLKSDILALQEVSISRIRRGVSHSNPLDTIAKALGPGWKYALPRVERIPEGHDNLFCAYLWNAKRVRLIRSFAMDLPAIDVDRAPLFHRKPFVGYFENLHSGHGSIDYALVNVHLKSGQSNTVNHLVAMALLEDRLTDQLTAHQVTEIDRIILGDFNDNPFSRKPDGSPRYPDTLYRMMTAKGYRNLVTAGIGTTRMNHGLDSLIDHILVNEAALRDMPETPVAQRYVPGDPSTFAAWRKTYSDHFPLSFTILNTKTRDDDGDFNHAPFSN